MLTIKVSLPEGWDEENNIFIPSKEQEIHLEHSLISLSKWESKWQKVFLSNIDKTYEETIDYIQCMTIDKNVDDAFYYNLDAENIHKINEYIRSPQSATFFYDEDPKKINREQITSELIYYWLVALNIPFECQKWHLNRLITLIKICNIKNQPPKKRSSREIMSRNAALNAARRKRMNTKG